MILYDRYAYLQDNSDLESPLMKTLVIALRI